MTSLFWGSTLGQTNLRFAGRTRTEPGDGLELEPAEPDDQMEPLELETDGTGTVGTGLWG